MPGVVPSVSDLFATSTKGGSHKLHLPKTKTGRQKGEDIFLCAQHDHTDPTGTIANHLAINGPTSFLPLFSYKTNHGLVALTKRKFLQQCNSIWSRHGLPSCSGHCFCIGGMTELLLRLVPPHIIKIMGRWSSDTFLRYWRNLEHIAPLHAEFLTPRLSVPI